MPLKKLYNWLWSTLGWERDMEKGGINIANSLRALYVFPAGAFLDFPDDKGYIEYRASHRPKDLRNVNESQSAWKIDAAIFGVIFQVVPRHLGPLPPGRIDVRIPDQVEWPSHLWDALDARDSVHLSRDRVQKIGISWSIANALSKWSTEDPDFKQKYENLPFGSTIRLPSIEEDASRMHPMCIPNNTLEVSRLSAQELQRLWAPEITKIPPEINYRRLRYERQLAPSITLVRLPAEIGEALMAFKSELTSPAILYHELKMLLTMSPMVNVIDPPKYLVTAPMPSDGNSSVVCGFLLKYYELGDIERILPERRMDGTLFARQQLQWAKELTAAFTHIRSSKCRFYSDLRMDNVFLERGDDGSEHVVLADFQQSRNIYNWAPPEIYYVEWIAELGHESFMRTDKLPENIVKKYSMLLDDYLSSRNYPLPLEGIPLEYDNPQHGWYFPWLSSTWEEQEAGMVYLLGKALWCLFEGVGDADIILGRSSPHEAEQRFPEFRRSPAHIRRLIRRCTEGAREWEEGPMKIYRREGKIFPLHKTGLNSEPVASIKETKEAVKLFWKEEVAKAEAFIKARMLYDKNQCTADDLKLLSYLRRPNLRTVQEMLERFCISQGRDDALL